MTTIKQRLRIKKTSLSSYRNPLIGRFKLYQGMNDKNTSIWCTYDDLINSDMFRSVHQIIDLDTNRRFHAYYSDIECNGLMIGFIARLSHGRFLYGYHSTHNGEWVIYPEVVGNLNEAAFNAEHCAEVNARLACEYDERFQECRQLEDERYEAELRLKELDVLIIDNSFYHLRGEKFNLVKKLKFINDKINSEYLEFV